MRHPILVLVFLFAAVTLYAQPSKLPIIENIKGYLFYNQNKYSEKSAGTFSENIIDNPDFYLWNTMIGEGSAKGRSNSTLIVVEMTNSLKDEYNSGYVRLTVTNESNKLLLSRTQDFNLYSGRNEFSAAFMIYDTGCEHVKIKAELLDSSKKKVLSVMKKVIEFNCGE